MITRLEQQRERIPERLERLRKSGLKKLSRTDPDSRFLRERGGFTLGYTATLAVSEDHLIVAQQVTQDTNDNEALLPMVDLVEQQCGEKLQRASADSGFFSLDNWKALEERKIDAYVPDSNLARWLNRGGGCGSGPVIRHIAACQGNFGTPWAARSIAGAKRSSNL